MPIISKLNSAFTTGIEVVYKPLTPNSASLTLLHYPFWPEHYQGIFYGGIESLGYKPIVTYDKKGASTYEYMLSWRKKEAGDRS